MTVESAMRLLAESLSGEVRADEPMSRHTSFRVGGPADLFVVCDSLSDLASGIRILDAEGVAHTVVGKGTNLLVSDDGYRGAVIVLGADFRHHELVDDRIHAGAAAKLAALVQDAFRDGRSGLAFAAGIPGTLGGALAMNAGATGRWIGEIVESLTLFVPGHGLERMKGGEVLWGYRGSGLPGRGIIVEGALKVEEGDTALIRSEMERNFRRRKETQPVGKACAGSVFLNPKEDSAGRLIEVVGLKGCRFGGAAVSSVHGNFIVNEGGATASDVMRAIRTVQETVRDVHGIELRPEIRFLGSFEEERQE